uniref:Uncharacterized protein n=1 Tax=viral metagenome TaxID=1070528 RepID=A0A6C0KNZ5_9ZZZZ
MNLSNTVLSFIKSSVNPALVRRIKTDKKLSDVKIQEYLNYNPNLVENQIKLYEADNDSMVFNKTDIDNIISKILNTYNNELNSRNTIPDPDPEENDDFPSGEEGIQMSKLEKGGKTKKRRGRKFSKNTPRYKKKSSRRKRKTG